MRAQVIDRKPFLSGPENCDHATIDGDSPSLSFLKIGDFSHYFKIAHNRILFSVLVCLVQIALSQPHFSVSGKEMPTPFKETLLGPLIGRVPLPFFYRHVFTVAT